jgi:miniconductance mechanosensitive channel
MYSFINPWLADQGLSARLIEVVDLALALVMLIMLWLVASLVARKAVMVWISALVRRSAMAWDDTLLDNQFFQRLGTLLPILVCYLSLDFLLAASPMLLTMAKRLLLVLLALVAVRILDAALNALLAIHQAAGLAEARPIRSYLDAGRIIIYCGAIIFVISILTNQSPWGILSVLGGLTAIILLIFKDTLLGFVANLQLTGHDLVRLGDWIEMEQFGADGTVIEITLHTVKVRNWDNTFIAIPSYALLSASFKNWRGMAESGGRRIKRSLYLDMTSVRFCTPEMLQRFQGYTVLRPYLQAKEAEIAAFHAKHGLAEPINQRRQTNLGIFRAYVAAYLRHNEQINQELTFLVRHLQPTPHGLPLEIYVFCKDKVWANYEGIQADIFDHLLAILPEFELRIFQNPSGHDFQRLAMGHPAGDPEYVAPAVTAEQPNQGP